MTVLKSSEIELNSKRFKINGLVRPRLASVWPEKLVVGDYTKSDELVASSWIISDQRGGCLIEEMEEDIHRDKFYWSTCNTDYKGHIILPPLATEVLCPSLATSPTSHDDPDTEWTDHAKAYNDDITDKAYDDVTANDWGSFLELIHAGVSSTVAIALYLSKESADITKVDVDAYYGGAWHGLYEDTFTDGAWLTVPLASAQTVTKIEVRFYNDGGALQMGYIHDVKFLSATTVITLVYANYNSKLYLGANKVFSKLNSTGDGFDYINDFSNNITSLTKSIGNNLYIFFGDAAKYQYMSTAEAFTEASPEVTDDWAVSTGYALGDFVNPTTYNGYVYECIAAGSSHGADEPSWPTTEGETVDDTEVIWICRSANATKSIHWDSKLFKMDSEGLIAYAVTPNAATPTWTYGGALGDEGLVDGDIQELIVYRDASGNPIIYAGTKIGLYAYDYTNSKWIQTELSLPNHPTCGAGVAWWRDACYLSAGLNVYEYIAGTIAYIASMGLDSSDGLPNKYTGEIDKLIEGYDNLFVLVGADHTTGTGYSSMFVYNGGAWRCRWVDGTADQAMHCGVVSSVYAYRFWWGVGDEVYYIGLERSLRNPLKVTDYPFATSSVHITPRFDAATPWNKTALRLKAICDKMDAGNEQIVVKYRINEKCYEGIDTANTWTTLVTLDTDGETSTDFGSSAGILYKVIQFRFDLARGAVDTKTPDLQRVTLVYERTTPAAWAWDVEIDLTQPYKGQSPEQMWENLEAIVDGGLLVPFTFTLEGSATGRVAVTHYVEIRGLEGTARTGEKTMGTYQLRLVAP